MIYLKLQSDKTLKSNQSALIYEGENLADSIKINITDAYLDYQCFLNILTSAGNMGDEFLIENNVEYPIDNKFLTVEQELIIWIEMRKDEILAKSSEVKVRVNKHHKVESIITDIEISAFEQLMREVSALYQETLEVKREVESLIGGIENIPNIEEINKKLEELKTLKEELENNLEKLENIPTKISQLENDIGFITLDDVSIPTKLSAFENDVGYIVEADIPKKLSDLENDVNYLSPDNLTPEIVEELKASLNQEVISF